MPLRSDVFRLIKAVLLSLARVAIELVPGGAWASGFVVLWLLL